MSETAATSPRRPTWSRTRAGGRQARADPRRAAGRAARQAHRAHSGFVYLARKLPSRRRGADPEAGHRRASSSPRRAGASTRATGWRRRCSAPWGPTASASRAWSTARRGAARQGRRAAHRPRRARPADLDARHDADAARAGRPADDRRRDPGQGRGGAARRRADLPAQGRDRARDGPAHRAGARDGQLAARERQRRQRRAALRVPEPRGRRYLRAGLDVQGRHRRRRAAGGARHARHDVQPPAEDPGRRPGHRRGARPRLRVADHVADPRAVSATSGAIKIGQRLGAKRLRPVGRAASGSARRPGIDLPGEERGHRAARWSKYSGSSMGNLPIGQGLAVTPVQMATAYAAIANGGVLRTAAGDPVRRRQARRRAGRQADHLRATRPARCARCSRASSRAGGPRPRPRSTATPGGQDRHGEQDRPEERRLLGGQVRRLVRGLRAGATTPSCWSP